MRSGEAESGVGEVALRGDSCGWELPAASSRGASPSYCPELAKPEGCVIRDPP